MAVLLGEVDLEKEEDVEDEPLQYWNSEHHRFQYSDHADVMCQINPLSYHQMGLAVPGTFVESGILNVLWAVFDQQLICVFVVSVPESSF